MDTWKRVALGALAVVAGVGLCVGLYFGYWALAGDTTDRRVGVTNRNLGTQTAWRDEALDLVNQSELLPEGAPAAARLRDQACELIARLTDNYRDDQVVAAEEEYCL